MMSQQYVMDNLTISPGRPTSYSRLEIFVDKWGNTIWSIIRRFPSLVDDYDDLYQHIIESWISQDKISEYNPTVADFSTYLYTYVIGHIRNWKMKKRRHNKRYFSLGTHDVLVDGPEPPVDFSHVYLEPDMYWLLLHIIWQVGVLGDKDVKQLASVKGLSVRAINYQIQKLRQILIDYDYVSFDCVGNVVWSNTLS